MKIEEEVKLRKIIDDNFKNDIIKYIKTSRTTNYNFLSEIVGLRYCPIQESYGYFSSNNHLYDYCISNPSRGSFNMEKMYLKKKIWEVIEITYLHYILLNLNEENLTLFLNFYEFDIYIKDSVDKYTPLDYARFRNRGMKIINKIYYHQKFKDCYKFSNYFDIFIKYNNNNNNN
jgi:hypothetical protein